MTISTEPAPLSYNGDGSTATFTISWLYYAKADVVVTLRDSSGVETTWVDGTQYTLSNAGVTTGGTLTVVTSPTDYTPAASETLVIELEPANTQDSSLPLGGDFPSTVVEEELDTAAQRDAKLTAENNRSIRVPKTDTEIGANLVLPIDSLRASKAFQFDSQGKPDMVTPTDASGTNVLVGSTVTTRSLSERFRNPTNFLDHGADPTGAADQTTIWNNCLSWCDTNSADVLIIPAGTYSFASKPNPISFPLTIIGAGFSNTRLRRDYTPSSADEPFMHITWSYVSFNTLDIVAGNGTSGGRGLSCVLTSSPATFGNWCWHRDIRVIGAALEGDGTWKWCVYLDGSDPDSSQGLRDWKFDNCWLFDGSTGDLYAESVRHFHWEGGFCSDTTIAGTGTGDDQSQNVILMPVSGNGALTADDVKGLWVGGQWSGGTIGSAVDNYNIIITDDNQWTLNSTDGVFLSQRQGPPILRMTDDGAFPILRVDRIDTHGGSNISIAEFDFRGKDSGGSEAPYVLIQIKATDDTAGSEDGELRIGTTVAGSNATLQMRIMDGVSIGSKVGAGTGTLTMDSVFYLETYLVAALPAVTTDGLIIVSDETSGLTVAFSDGTNWRRVQDRAIVS